MRKINTVLWKPYILLQPVIFIYWIWKHMLVSAMSNESLQPVEVTSCTTISWKHACMFCIQLHCRLLCLWTCIRNGPGKKVRAFGRNCADNVAANFPVPSAILYGMKYLTRKLTCYLPMWSNFVARNVDMMRVYVIIWNKLGGTETKVSTFKLPQQNSVSHPLICGRQ
jgi:hypothetical protein